MVLVQGIYYEARAISGSRKSEWSNREHLRVTPDYSHGGAPSQPRNVLVTPASSCSPDRTNRPEHDPDPNTSYDWDDCFEWNISWDAPSSDGGWPIEVFGYGDVVHETDYAGHPPARYCLTGETWRYMYVSNRAIQSNPKSGRTYGFNAPTALPEGWTIGINAETGRARSSCVRVEPDFP